MRVICIDDREAFGIRLTNGQSYEVIRQSSDGEVLYLIDNATGSIGWSRDRFITQDEFRDGQIETLLSTNEN